jgi:hypothetical protein
LASGVHATALRSSTPILKPKVDSGELQIVGANYSLDADANAFLEK